MTTKLNWLGYVGTTLNLLAFMPAMLHVLLSRTSCGINMYTLFLRIVASCFWLGFAFENEILPTKISGFLTIAFVLVYMGLVLRYSRGCTHSPWSFPFTLKSMRSLVKGRAPLPSHVVESDSQIRWAADHMRQGLRLPVELV